jgi:hypothetical protein
LNNKWTASISTLQSFILVLSDGEVIVLVTAGMSVPRDLTGALLAADPFERSFRIIALGLVPAKCHENAESADILSTPARSV